MFLLFMSQGSCALEDDQRAERGFANKLISFLTVQILLSLGNTGINWELVEMQNLGGLPYTPSSVYFMVLQYPLLCLP